MIKDFFATLQVYNIMDNKPNEPSSFDKSGFYEKIKIFLEKKYDLSNITLRFAPLYPDGTLGEIEWIYNLFVINDFKDFKPKKIAVICDSNEELPKIKVGEVTIVEFITISSDEFTKALKEVIRSEKIHESYS